MNARSLGPKLESLSDCISELEADVAIVTETWLQDGQLANTIIDSARNFGLDVFARNRQDQAANGRQYGGVAIFTRSGSSNFREITVDNPEGFEVLCVSGKISKIKEKVVVIAVYIPTNYPRSRADMCLDYISDVIAEAKRRVDSPLIVVGGDWNQ